MFRILATYCDVRQVSILKTKFDGVNDDFFSCANFTRIETRLMRLMHVGLILSQPCPYKFADRTIPNPKNHSFFRGFIFGYYLRRFLPLELESGGFQLDFFPGIPLCPIVFLVVTGWLQTSTLQAAGLKTHLDPLSPRQV